MEDIGVLVQNYGIKRQGKSAPMAALKTGTKTTTQNNKNTSNQDPPFFSKSTDNTNSVVGSFLDNQNDPFGFSFTHNNKPQSYGNHDIFDMPVNSSSSSNGGVGGKLDFDIESMLKGSVNLNANSSDVNDDVIWGGSGKRGNTVVVDSNNDLLSSDPVDDFWVKLDLNQRKNLGENKGSNVDSDDLIPGFGFGNGNAGNDRAQASSTEKSAGLSSVDELEDFVRGKIKETANVFKNEPKKFEQTAQKTSFFDVDESYGDNVSEIKVERDIGKMWQEETPDLNIFSDPLAKKSVPVSMSKEAEEVPDLFPGTTFNTEKKSSPTNFPDDFLTMWEDTPISGKFEEYEEESDERRRLRYERHQRMVARQKEVLEAMKQREFEAQQEQEERHRFAEGLDMEMKRWAAGKEGNLRALLSSLQQVLGPESGWQPVTLTDLITSSQVKVAFRKANLYVHPDKLQQRGASLQQKLVAEKVFDLLQDAWNKFSSAELR